MSVKDTLMASSCIGLLRLATASASSFVCRWLLVDSLLSSSSSLILITGLSVFPEGDGCAPDTGKVENLHSM